MFEVGDVIADTDAGMLATVLEVEIDNEKYVLRYSDNYECVADFSDTALTYPCPVCNGAEISSAHVFGSDIVVRVCENCGEEWT